MTEYTHTNGIVFAVNQIWENGNGGKFKIVKINQGVTYPIKARKISQYRTHITEPLWTAFTKNGAFIDDFKEKNSLDLKRLVINSGETVKNNEAQS